MARTAEITATNATTAEPEISGRAVLQQLRTQGKEESSIMIVNIEGIFTRKKRHKIGVRREIAETKGIIMLALTESHLREDIQDGEIEMKDFQHCRTDREEGRRKGGVIVYLRKSQAAKTVPLQLG
jgi:hypothetical protein